MRKSLWISLIVLFAIGAPSARADSYTDYTITFLVVPDYWPTSPPTGTFVFDDTTQQFTSFTVVWHGLTFDLTAAANNPTIYNRDGCSPSLSGADLSLALLTTCVGRPGIAGNNALFSASTAQAPGPAFMEFVAFDIDESFTAGFIGFSTGPPTIAATRIAGNFTSSVTGTTVTPEPSSIALMLAGIGVLLVMRKRIAKGFQPVAGPAAL